MNEDNHSNDSPCNKSAVLKKDFQDENQYSKYKINKKRPRSRSRSYSRSRSRSSSRSTNNKKPRTDPESHIKKHGHFYCTACDVLSPTLKARNLHEKGRSHKKNKKNPDPGNWKFEYLDEEDPSIKQEIDADIRPIVGLKHICETQRLEQKPIYSCFLCSASLPDSQQLLEHIQGVKHRLAFLKEHDLEKYKTCSQLRKPLLETIVQACIMEHEKNDGRGKMIVRREKNKSVEDTDSDEILELLEHINKRENDLNIVNSEIEIALTDPTVFDNEFKTSEEYSDKITIIKFRIKNRIQKINALDNRFVVKRESRPAQSACLKLPKTHVKQLAEFEKKKEERQASLLENQRCWSRALSDYERSKDYGHDNRTIRKHPRKEEERRKELRRHESYSDSEWKKICYETKRHYSEYRSSFNTSQYYSRSRESDSKSPYYQTSRVICESTPKLERNDHGSSHLQRTVPESRCSDLREVLEQKKSLGYLSSIPAAGNSGVSGTESTTIPLSDVSSFSNSIEKVTDSSPEMLFELAFFKSDNMDIKIEKILSFINYLLKRATELSLKVKTSKISPSLQEKFQESVAKTVTLPQSNPNHTQNIEELIHYYKSQKSLNESHFNQFQNSAVIDRSSELPMQYPKDYSRHLTGEKSTPHDYKSYQSCTSVPLQGFSTTPTTIPGLTLIEGITSHPDNTAKQNYQQPTTLEYFAERARNILGHIKVPLNQQ
ncbi:u1-type domain-containing protein [Nephila pilipes]|uniref:U1-type domain-containing protein n=1 Tax=Nephila pilipes TaxID=299642 RepID=A0A8X6UIE1_NEPPI|nr:u1-type domain-containing protein [Nephila pilipes]